MAGMLIAVAMLSPILSCNQKEDAAKNNVAKGKPEMTPEQAKKAEEINRGNAESKNVVVARVNGADIIMFDLVKEMNALVWKYVAAGQPTTPEINAKVKKEALDKLIFRELAIQEAIKDGLKVEPNAVEDVINKVRMQAGSEEAYKKYLEERSLNEDDLKRTVARSHLLEMVTAKKIFDKIKVDDKVLRDAYEKDKASFMRKDNPPQRMSFEEAKGLIERKIKSERGQKMLVQWDNELREKAKIEIMLDEAEQALKKDG